VKSGPPLPDNAVAADGRVDSCVVGVAARESAAVRIRPVTTRPATKPATISVSDSVKRLAMASADRDAPRGPFLRLGNRDGQHAVLEVGLDAVDVDRFRQREPAREAAVAA